MRAKNEGRPELGIVGLGRMGASLALQALEKGFRVAGTSAEPPARELLEAGLVFVASAAELPGALSGAPRRIMLYIPVGIAVDELIEALAPGLARGDVIADGGNSYWQDSRRRQERLAARGIRFLDVGTSGGVEGARRGACFMVGGERDAVAAFEPALRALAIEGGYVHAGGPGAGHFVKLVHNGIEFGMLQAIGEGVELLERSETPLNVAGVLQAWQHGSVVRSWLIELLSAQYSARGDMNAVPSFIEDTGEVNWLVADALRMEVPIPVIAQAVMQLFASRDDKKEWARAIALMRHGFGGHPLGPDEAIRRLRHTARLSDAEETAEAARRRRPQDR
jgi:6-phosphogluconate dehydrogenase